MEMLLINERAGKIKNITNILKSDASFFNDNTSHKT
jgi:hypothetical protein